MSHFGRLEGVTSRSRPVETEPRIGVPSTAPAHVLALQRAAGNRATTALLRKILARVDTLDPMLATLTAGDVEAMTTAELDEAIHRIEAELGVMAPEAAERESIESNLLLLRDRRLSLAPPDPVETPEVDISDGDRRRLQELFAEGFTLGEPMPLILGMRFGARYDGYRVTGIRVTSATHPVQPGVETYFFQVGKGRAILVSSIGGGSVLFDAGVGQTTSVNAPTVRRLVEAIGAVTAGTVAVPEVIRTSHPDTDHWGAQRALLQESAFSNVTVEVALQQLGASSGGRWTRSSLTVNATQKLVTIDVSGGSVHVRREVIDNMVLTEFRSVEAHDRLADPSRRTYNRNRSSPVTVVHDTLSGERWVYLSDSEGRVLTEIVDAVGDAGMRRILGAAGRNLRGVEAAHHYGAQAGADASGMLNFLQLAYESGGGATRLMSQTTESFSTRASSSYNFLDALGLAPERIEGDPSGPGQSQMTRVRGSTAERVTLDTAGAQRAIEAIQAQDTMLLRAYAQRGEIEVMRAEVAAMQSALEGPQAPRALVTSLAATETELATAHQRIQTATGRIWDNARAVARDAGGMRNDANLTRLTQALAQLSAVTERHVEPLEQAQNAVETYRNGLTLYSRLFANAARMMEATLDEDIRTLHRCRAEHTDLVRAARAAMGSGAVRDHVREAMQATRETWNPERIQQVAREVSRQMVRRLRNAELRRTVSVSLARQMALNEIVERASHGGRTAYARDGSVVTPASTRVGAGLLAAIEIIRIGLELAEQWEVASEASEAREARSEMQGLATMDWWDAQGVRTRLALAAQGTWSQRYSIVYDDDSDAAREAALSGTPPEGVDEFGMVVVTGVRDGDLRRLVRRLVGQLANQRDWASYVASHPVRDPLKKLDDEWCVLLWSADDDAYRYFRVDDEEPGVGAELDRLHRALDAGQQAELDLDVINDGGPAMTVANSALVFGHDREVYVYNHYGNLEPLDFDDVSPCFLRRGTEEYPVGGTGPMELVSAADLATYRRLASQYWVREGQLYVTGREHPVVRNSNAYAYAEPGTLTEANDPALVQEAHARVREAGPPLMSE